MKVLLISAILLQAWCNAYPKPKGVASYVYTDTDGNRYGGTYDLGNNIAPFSDPIISSFSDPYVPEFFNNFGNILPQIDLKNQRPALLNDPRAFNPTYQRRGYNPSFSRFPFGGFPFGPSAFNVNRFGENAAFASSAIAPGYRHQSAIISPANADIPNVSLTDRFAEPSDDGKFYSVSSSSFASSDNDNGKLSGFRQAETVVNDNGKITKYRVHS
ncbi:uncharacterized protein LOC116779088 isoform X1 [Danaus plexippus]|uniref:uncharacterized protein LOC116779088 isoform X1 n=1 Tax=Danaus plexippus TaxID=13037 RepID=UPI002AB1D3CA|nr:uncharacterized protein LOC116779088 isoform X1 [Danaus plexippus]